MDIKIWDLKYLHISQCLFTPAVNTRYWVSMFLIAFSILHFAVFLAFFIVRANALVFFTVAFAIWIRVLMIIFVHVVKKTVLTDIVFSTFGTIKLFTFTDENIISAAVALGIGVVRCELVSHFWVAIVELVVLVFLIVVVLRLFVTLSCWVLVAPSSAHVVLV